MSSDIWEIRPLPTANDDSLSQIKKQRVVKIAPHQYIDDYKDYEVSVYVDCSILIKTDLNRFVDGLKTEYGEYKMAVTIHPVRKCIYKEQKTVVAVKKDTEEITKPQIEKYKELGFPEDYGLHETCLMIRFRDDKIDEIMNDWKDELVMHSHRDQLSFNYVLWKHDYKIVDIPVLTRNKNFRIKRHKNVQKPSSKTLNK